MSTEELPGKRRVLLRLPLDDARERSATPGGLAELKADAGVPAAVEVVTILEDAVLDVATVILEHPGYRLVPIGVQPPVYGPRDAGLIPSGRGD